MSKKTNNWRWFAGASDEYYDLGDFASRDGAVLAIKNAGLDWGCIVEAKFAPIDISSLFNADEWLESIEDGDGIQNYTSEYGENPLYDLPDSKLKLLTVAVRDAMKKWQNEHDINRFGDIFSETRNHEEIEL